MAALYKFTFYVPESHLELVKNAMFEAGAGRIGDYDKCSWQVKGRGQFRPLPGSHAFIGTENNLEIVSEYRVEMICQYSVLRKVRQAMLKAHPYEEPAYDVIKTLDMNLEFQE